MAKGIYLDISRCIYCRSCEVACEREHAGAAGIFVQLIDERTSVPVSCRHCEDGPCTKVCPTGALHRERGGAVVISPMMCIGCALCTIACPFGAVWFDSANRVARKCDLCGERTSRGLEPACVTTCSAKALAYGELIDLLAAAPYSDDSSTYLSRAAGETGMLIRIKRTSGPAAKPLEAHFSK